MLRNAMGGKGVRGVGVGWECGMVGGGGERVGGVCYTKRYNNNIIVYFRRESRSIVGYMKQK